MVLEKSFVGEINADGWEWNQCIDLSWEGVKNKVLPKIINYERNESLLQGVPYIKYLDMAVVFYISLNIGENGIRSITLKKEHTDLWNVDIGDILMCVKKNAVYFLPESIYYMDELIIQLVTENKNKTDCLDDMLGHIGRNQNIRMLVLSNQKNIFGACCIIYDGVLQRIAGIRIYIFYQVVYMNL